MTRVTYFQSNSADGFKYWVFHLDNPMSGGRILVVTENMAYLLDGPATPDYPLTWNNNYTDPESWSYLWDDVDLDPDFALDSFPTHTFFMALWT